MSTQTSSRLDTVCADLRDRDYSCPDGPTETNPIVAVGGDHPIDGPDAPLSVTRLREVTPLSIASAISTAAHAGHAPVLVVDEWGTDDARAILEEPFLLRDRVDDARHFYSIPERIVLTDGRYACVRTDCEPQWREDPAMSTDTDRMGSDEPRLLLEADGSIQAVIESPAELYCPGPEPAAFPYRYSRGDDKRIHVFDRSREVGRYAGISAMADNAYRPVSMPLIPERHIETGGRLARNVTLATVTDGDVAYERP